jgi:hypothetical protein
MPRILDIEKIKNAKLLTTPWEHKIIDNFFPQSNFLKIKEAAKFLSKFAEEEKTKPILIKEALEYGISEIIINDIIDATDDILDNIQDILSGFSVENNSNLGYYSIPKFGVSGKNFKYPIHTESNHKIILFVIYLEPDTDRGTRLYREKTETSFAKEIEWQPNRAFVMCPANNDITWHNWINFSSPARVTLNIFCETLESLQTTVFNSKSIKNASTEEVEDILWLYDQFNKNKLTTNKIS